MYEGPTGNTPTELPVLNVSAKLKKAAKKFSKQLKADKKKLYDKGDFSLSDFTLRERLSMVEITFGLAHDFRGVPTMKVSLFGNDVADCINRLHVYFGPGISFNVIRDENR